MNCKYFPLFHICVFTFLMVSFDAQTFFMFIVLIFSFIDCYLMLSIYSFLTWGKWLGCNIKVDEKRSWVLYSCCSRKKSIGRRISKKEAVIWGQNKDLDEGRQKYNPASSQLSHFALTSWRSLPRNSVFSGGWITINCLREKPNLTLLFLSTLKRLWIHLSVFATSSLHLWFSEMWMLYSGKMV